MKIYKSVSELVGHTPVLELSNIEKELNLKAKIFAKLEYFNPAGSSKDRIAKKIIEDAEASGKIKEGSVIIEPTSGNTGIGLAAIGVSRGYRIIIVMPDSMSVERRKLISAYGAELVLTPGNEGISASIKKANELAEKIPDSFIAGQFSNLSNPKAHYETTGPEIWNDMDGRIDFFIAGAGTGGTLSGTGRFLKEKNKDIVIYAVEPASSRVLMGEKASAHKLQGIGADFIPDTFDRKICDGIIDVSDEAAFDSAGMLAKKEGILAGISSGAALWAAIETAKKDENEGRSIVVLLPDTGERYLSTEMFI